MSTEAQALTLHALGGKEPPPELGSDLLRILRLPPEALQSFWQVLGPCLPEPLSKDAEKLLDVYCSAHHLEMDDVARAIRACRFLVMSAVKLDVPASLLAEDLDHLCPDEPLLRELILAGYEPVKAPIRQALSQAALVDHGKVLVGAQWRLDMVDSTEQGTKLRLPVAMLTLHYRHGEKTGRITLQVLPDMMGELKTICEKVLSR